MLADLTTLTDFLARRQPAEGGDLDALLLDAVAAWTGHVTPTRARRGEYLLLFDPHDGASNMDVNVPVGSIFSIVRASNPGIETTDADFLQPGTRQICAGYAIHGPRAMLVITVDAGVQGFTLDPQRGDFILTHPNLAIPERTSELAVDDSNRLSWEPAVSRYVGECLAGKAGPRGRDFDSQAIGSLVAETHRMLMRGGICLCPRLLREANPIALIVERAAGRASTGRGRVLDLVPRNLHQRIAFIFGSREEVERVERYHRDHNQAEFDAPLFGARGLYRANS